MNKMAVLVLIGFTILGCANDDQNSSDDNSTTKCDFQTLISEEKYKNAPSDDLTINTVIIEKDCLKINFSSGGCDGSTWEIQLIDSESILESNPPQRNLRLSLKNTEECLAYITKEFAFDISNLKPEGNKVWLNITNSEQRILYEYE